MTGVARFTIQAQLILLGDAFDARFADRILQTLELDPALAPQRWGEEPGIRDPYDRSDFLQAIIDRPEDAAPQLYRTQTCKYSAEWYGYERLLTNLSFRTGDLDRTEGEIFFDAISLFMRTA